MTGFTVVDRYSATGTPYPDPATICLGQCEGTGCVPIQSDETDPRFLSLWQKEHAETHNFVARLKCMAACDFMPWHRRIALLWEKCDGWHFVTCPDCNGTRVRPTDEPGTL